MYNGLFSCKNPINFFDSIGCVKTLKSFTEISPESAFIALVILFIKVDFPAPFGPSKPTTSPLSIENETLSKATCSPYFFTKSVMIIPI